MKFDLNALAETSTEAHGSEQFPIAQAPENVVPVAPVIHAVPQAKPVETYDRVATGPQVQPQPTVQIMGIDILVQKYSTPENIRNAQLWDAELQAVKN